MVVTVFSTVMFSVWFTHRLNHGQSLSYAWRVAAALHFPKTDPASLKWHQKLRLHLYAVTGWFRGGSLNHNGFVFASSNKHMHVDVLAARVDRKNHQRFILRLMHAESSIHFPMVTLVSA